ncbi:WecB/TagA/CpsF family glycosyltransferase [Microbacterium lushaniae]|nr:WecB/TagA/CpsF family glycosyltransferase [Microbacterium lushaniae]KAA9159876.1 WecB/TagA/CpsF family glycosyltransferase [Microbacterium lushaniae]
MSEATATFHSPPRVRVPLLEVEVTPLSAQETAQLILDRVNAGTGAVIGNLNLHGAYVFHTDEKFRRFCELSDVVLVDGAPIAWLGRIPTSLRVGSTDWLDALMPTAVGLEIVAIGGSEEAARGAERYMRERYPAVGWTGIDGYNGRQPRDEFHARVRKADVVLVGLGMPLQERWLLENRDLLAGKVVANVGGCIDYYAGVQNLAPRWMGRLGIEWLYRLLRNPRRLAHRYLIEPFKLARILLARRRHRISRSGSP